jgi:Tfp pilus assembly protein FimT
MTLLEVVMVCLLVGLMAGVATFSIADMLRRQNCASAIEQMKDLIEELQVEALALNSDLQLRIYQDKKGWKACSLSDEKILRRRTIDLKGVRQILFNQNVQPQVTLEIFSTGRIAPEGTLSLKQDQGNITIEIKEHHATFKSSILP